MAFAMHDDRFSILRVAEEAGLSLHPLRHRPEFRTQCPFCTNVLGEPDTHKIGHMYVNLKKDTFHCYRCGESGGVIKFYALLHGIDFDSARQALRGEPEQAQPKRKRHPAESLSPEQLKQIGYERGSTFLKKPPHMSEQDFQVYRKRTLDMIWKEWNLHLSNEKASLRRLMKAMEAVLNNQNNEEC